MSRFEDPEIERIFHQLRIIPNGVTIGEGDLEEIYSQDDPKN